MLCPLLLITALSAVCNNDGNPLSTPQQDEIHHNMILKNYAAYNYWANVQLSDWLQEGAEEQIHMEVESSFNSLAKTIIHLWNAEYGWLQTLENKSWGTPPGQNFEGSIEELVEGFLATSKSFEEYVLNLETEEFSETRALGQDGDHIVVEEIILHVFNHATYHRGQLITIGRQVGLTQPPRTDYIYFVRLKE